MLKRRSATPRCINTRKVGITTSNVIGDMLQPDVNTQTRRTLRTGSEITICLPLRAINTVCHDRHKTVLEFILNSYDVDENHMTRFVN